MRTTRKFAAIAAALVLGMTGACGGNDTAEPGSVSEGTGPGAPDDTDAGEADEGEAGGPAGY